MNEMYLAIAEDTWPEVLEYYEMHEDKRPVMLLDCFASDGNGIFR